MFKKLIVIDAKGHLAGRLASYVAKELLNGQRITIVRCEKTLISGSKYRNKIKVMDFKNKRMSTNPKKGPIHQRAPAQMLLRKIRGMVPHKTPIGAAAMGRIKCFDGCPLSYNNIKKFVVRDALKCVRLKPRARYCCIGDVATVCGWTKGPIINSFEAKRVGANREWHLKRQKARTERKTRLAKSEDLKKVNAELASLGY
jgi:large subunit ribosomal protein L13Ae